MRVITASLAMAFALGIAMVARAEEDLETLNERVSQLQDAGRFAEAIPLARRSLELTAATFGADSLQATTRMLWLGSLLQAQGDFKEVEALLQRALAIRERALGANHPATAAIVNNLGGFYLAQGRYAEAEPLFKRSVACVEEHVGPKHPQTATSLNNLAGVYLESGRYAEARPLMERALAIREETLGPDHEDTAASLGNLAGVLRRQGDFAGAEPLYRRAAEACERTLGPEHPATALGLNNLGGLYDSQGRHARAEPFYERAVAIWERTLGPDHPVTAGGLNNLAGVLAARGRYAEAEPLYERALAIKERTLGPEHPDTAVGVNNLAEMHRHRGDYDRAKRLHERALAIRERALGKDHPDTAQSVSNLAFVEDALGRPAVAAALLERAVGIFERSLGGDHPDTALTLNNLAEMHRQLGSHESAETLSKRALAIQRKVLGPDHSLTAGSMNNLAMLYMNLGRHAEALPLCERAVAVKQDALGPDHPETALALTNLAIIQVNRGRFAEAASLFDKARQGMRRHVARILPALATVEQTTFLHTQHERDYHASLTFGLVRKASPEVAALSAGWLANGKAVGQEAAAQQIILARQSENAATKAAVAALEAARADLARLSQTAPAPAEAAAYRGRIAELQAEEQRLVHRIGGQLAALDRDEPWVAIEEIRGNIPAGSVFVDIARFRVFDFEATNQDDPWQPARYAAWIVPPAGQGDVTILDLGPAAEIEAAVAAYRGAIDVVARKGFQRGQATAEDELKVTAAPLAARVLQPIVGALGKADEFILSPDGALWLVPWQALPLADGSYVIEKFTIRTVTSGRDLLPVPDDATAAAGAARGPLVVADPAFDAAPAASVGPSPSSTRSFVPAGRRFEAVARLTATLAEARASAAALGKIFSGEPRQFTGTAATEENVKREALRPAALVVATHGFFLEDQVAKRDDTGSLGGPGNRGLTVSGEPVEDPLLRCGLLLAGANLTTAGKTLPGDDGILTGAEIVGLDLLGTKLVVLSACETAAGKVNTGEGVAGLRQAFQIAGARSVVATLWQVPDVESALLMQSFYGNLAKGAPPATALRDAQLAFINARRADRNYEAAHPYLWAAYGVTGR